MVTSPRRKELGLARYTCAPSRKNVGENQCVFFNKQILREVLWQMFAPDSRALYPFFNVLYVDLWAAWVYTAFRIIEYSDVCNQDVGYGRQPIHHCISYCLV